jgi:ubiquinone/menaquinone biosynthesis C-methylase UbiE
MKPPSDDVRAYYEGFAEESRLSSGPFLLEFERTKDILARVLRKPPLRIIDVGGAAGAYSGWLAAQGYEVHLVDLSPRLVAEARKRSATLARPIASLNVGDARALPQADAFAEVVLVMGPLYHLTTPDDRQAALREALRVLTPAGRVIVAAISRYASALDGLARKLATDPVFARIRDQDLRDGQHRNPTQHPEYFTTAYFHRPEDLRGELEHAGFRDVGILGVEGPAWMLADFEVRWGNPALRKDMMDVARALENEPSIQGASAHLIGVGRKPGKESR